MAKNEEQNFAELYENSLKKLEEGTTVKGTIVDIVGDEIFVDLGYKADGIIPRDEFSYGDEKPSDKYKVGDEIEAYILKMNDGRGNVLLSAKRLQTKQLREKDSAFYKKEINELSQELADSKVMQATISFEKDSQIIELRTMIKKMKKYISQK